MPRTTEQRPPAKLVPATAAHRDFVRSLSGEVFSHFGGYDTMLPGMMELPWVRTVIAEADSAAIGFAMYSLEGIDDGEVDLVAIAVSPDWQSRGVGSVLLEHVESEARNLIGDRTATVRLTVAVDNVPARKLFGRFGYAPIPEERGVYPGGQRSVGLRKSLR